MPYYETVFMARPDLTEAQVKKLTDGFSGIITAQGGKISKIENWGLRTLAYRINKSRKAHYVLIESDAPAEAVIELERLMRIEEDVMRSLTIRLEALSEGPSAILGRYTGNDDDSDDAPANKDSDKSEKEAA